MPEPVLIEETTFSKGRRCCNRQSDPSTFAGRLMEARKRRGITQQELADHIMIGRAAVANWEHGTSIPRPAVAGRLASFLNVDPGHLLYGTGTEAAPVSEFDKALEIIRGARWTAAEATALKALIDVGTI